MAHVGFKRALLAAVLAALLPIHGALASPAQRIVSLAPHVTELLYAAGAGDRIIATVTSSDFPPAALEIPRIGNGMVVDAEKIIALRPDLVAAWGDSGPARTLAPLLSGLDIPLIHVDPRSLDEVAAELLRLGAAAGTLTTARPAAQALQARINKLRRRYADRSPVRVFIEIGTQPLYTVGRDPLINDALHACGGVNIYGQSPIAAPQVRSESVLVAQPDVVITATESPEAAKARIRTWSLLHLGAARHGRVYRIDPDQLFRPTPRLIDATERLCEILDQARPAPSDGKVH